MIDKLFYGAIKQERRVDETYEDYKSRRTMVNKFIKGMLKGRFVWDSSPDERGKGKTYRRTEPKPKRPGRARRNLV